MTKKTLYLVDIFSFIFRAYYAIRPLSAADGTPVNAVYGVVTMLHKLIQSKKPDHLVICADSKEKNFRYEIFPEYKANRGAPPEDLIPQIDLVWEFLANYPMKVLMKDGYEADDIIATLVNQYKSKKDMEIFIVSSDKDLMQLIDDDVFLYDTMKNKISSFKEVEEKFGVTPDKVVDVQALCGDSSDNIPGIPGVGPKTATKLIVEYGSMENALDNAENLKGKMKERVMENKDLAIMSKKLVALAKDVPLDCKWEDLEIQKPQQDKLNEFYARMNFKTLIKEVSEDGEASPQKEAPKAKFITLQTLKDLKSAVTALKKSKSLVAFDTETTDIDALRADLVGLSFCFDDKKAYYVPIAHKEGTNLPLDDVREIFGAVLADSKIEKVAQNAKFDIKVLHRHGFEISGLKHDTLLASYLANPDGSHSLDFLADRYLGYKMIAFKDVVGKGQTFADVDIESATKYAAEDAWVTYKLAGQVLEELAEQKVEPVYNDIEVPLIDVLTRMEEAGILVDQKLLDKLEKEFNKRIEKLQKSIFELAGEEFNVNSPKQLQEILFDKLGLTPTKKTKTGYSTDVSVLTDLADEHDLPKFLLEFRTLTKLLSTYVVGLKSVIHPETGRVHTHFNQTIAATGRLSSTEPNLQNIPIKTEEGRRIREVFVAPKGQVLLSADYSQIELRLLAAFTKDPQLVQAYQNEEDIHAKTASVIFGMKLSEVTPEQRSIGKTINFGVVYGQSPFGLAKQLGIPQSEAKHFIDSFYREFSLVKDYKEHVIEGARQNGYVTTYLGRKRFLPDIKSKNFMSRQNAERVAFNSVFQGSAADLIKKAMIEIDAKLLADKLKTRMLLQVHDELVFEVPENELESVKAWVPELMSGAFKLDVPLSVSLDTGQTWGEAH